MEEELVSTLFPDFSGGGDYINPRSPYAYTRYFRDCLPYLMAMGMSPEEFWDGDPDLALAYRQAHELEQEAKFDMRNEYAWIQGAYIYSTLLQISPLFSSFADKKTKYGDYPEKPFDFTGNEEEVDEETAMQKERDRALAKMRGWAANFDKKFSDVSEE